MTVGPVVERTTTDRVGERDINAEVLRRAAVFRRSLACADIAAAGFALSAGIFAIGDQRIAPLALILLPIVLVVSKLTGLYDRDEHLIHKTTLDDVPMLFWVATLTTLLTFLLAPTALGTELSHGQVVAVWALLFIASFVLRDAARMFSRSVVGPERCFLIGDPAMIEGLRANVAMNPPRDLELSGWADADADGHSLSELLTAAMPAIDEGGVHRVIVAPESFDSDDIFRVIERVKESGRRVSVLSRPSDLVGHATEIDRLDDTVLLGVRGFEISRSSRLIKRGLDVSGALVALMAFTPVLAAAAIAIKLSSRGPVLFRQTRIGHNGQPFKMLKLRSMVDGAHARRDEFRHLSYVDGLFKITDDPRITRVGRVLRQTYLDEVPQMINVLRGDMSLVGPRPLVPDEDALIQGIHRRRLTLRPGITGHWQVMGSARVPLRTMVKLDYYYVANWSVWGDMKIILRTFARVFARHGH